MVGKVETLPCVTINPDGTVRVIVDGKAVDLSYADYIISRDSGKSPLSRVFASTPPKIIKPNNNLEED
ncbi:MAG: hypothetical protein WC851_03130 [Candidatus Shapirobacteria bacterium]|jgi:hypothetical protein